MEDQPEIPKIPIYGSTEWLIEHRCTRKRKYKHKKDALEVIKRVADRRVNKSGRKQTVYFCHLCDNWHIGSVRNEEE